VKDLARAAIFFRLSGRKPPLMAELDQPSAGNAKSTWVGLCKQETCAALRAAHTGRELARDVVGDLWKGVVMANDNHRSVPAVRVLVVEDFEPFRQFVCSTLSALPNVQIAAEVSDGLDAVRKAEELQPELILLDVGLPRLNGIDAARQIRTVCPNSRIIFVSQESDPSVVQEALSLGASGYVAKSMAAGDLNTALDAVLDGRKFVSDGLQDEAQVNRSD